MFKIKIKLKLKDISWVPGLEGVLKEGDIVTHKDICNEFSQVNINGKSKIKLSWENIQNGVICHCSINFDIRTFVDLFKQEIFKK